MVTAAPSRAICVAMAFPMPLSAPVMIATLFCKRMASSYFSRSGLTSCSTLWQMTCHLQGTYSMCRRRGARGHIAIHVVALALHGRLDELAQALLKDTHVELGDVRTER